MKSIISEGLRIGDLEDLVLPLISIDEFESKISKDAIVVALFVDDEEPASELRRFIEKGYTTLLDVDLSPAPNPEGYFLVFIEFIRDKKFPKEILNIIENLSKLVSIEKWKFKAYGEDGLHEFNLENLKKYVRLSDNEKEKKEAIEKLKESVIDQVRIEGNNIILEKHSIRKVYEFVDYGELNKILVKYKLYSQSNVLDNDSIFECLNLTRLLGNNWVSSKIGNYIVLNEINDTNSILLKRKD